VKPPGGFNVWLLTLKMEEGTQDKECRWSPFTIARKKMGPWFNNGKKLSSGKNPNEHKADFS
jgi:hypothetical protein